MKSPVMRRGSLRLFSIWDIRLWQPMQVRGVRCKRCWCDERASVLWRTKSEYARMPCMPPTPPANLTMSEEEVAKLRHGLAHLAPSHVEAAYRKSLAQLVSTDLPTPRMVQEFVTIWKLLWR